MKKDIFKPREEIQPYEYPELLPYANVIWNAFWEPDHFTYEKDIRDFKIELTENEQLIVKRCMLAVGLIENKVKSFWGDIGKRMPKVEISDVGAVFSGNETVHRRTYEKILNLLNLQDEFSKIMEVPCMDDRVKYLSRYLNGVTSRSDKEFTKSLILFTLMVENCSLFSQFLILSSFKKYKNVFKSFSEIVNATAREEILHGKFGSHLVNIIREENPDWFDQEMEDKIRRNVRKAYKAEAKVLDWIFEEGELKWISKEEILEFLKDRFNISLNLIGYEDEYELNKDLLQKSKYMNTMLLSTLDVDFFDQKVSDYNKSKSFQEDELW